MRYAAGSRGIEVAAADPATRKPSLLALAAASRCSFCRSANIGGRVSSKRPRRRSDCAGPQGEAAPSGWWNSSARWPRLASPPPGTTPLPPPARSARQPTPGAASGSSCSFQPPWPTWRAWPPSPVTRLQRQPPSARRALRLARAAERSPPPRSATLRASWPGTAVKRPQAARHRLGHPDPRRTGGRPPRQRRLAQRHHRPAAVHRARHRQGAPVPHLRQARHHHPRRTGRTGSLTGSDRQKIWRVTHRHGGVGWVAQLVLSCG